MEILLGGPVTASEIVELAAEFHGDTGHPLKAEQKGALRTLIFDAALGRAYLLKVNGVAAGYATVMFRFSVDHAARVGFIDDLYVRAAHRGKGGGSALLLEIQSDLRKLGSAGMSLCTEPGGRAKRLFLRNGFRASTLLHMDKSLS